MDPDPFRLLLNAVDFDSALVLKLVTLIILLVFSALISGAEVAFFGLSATEINEIDQEKTSKGGIIVKLL